MMNTCVYSGSTCFTRERNYRQTFVLEAKQAVCVRVGHSAGSDSLRPHGFPRQEHWSQLPFSSPGDIPDSGIEPGSPALAVGFFNI